MLTTEDIKNLTEYQKEAFKDVFATKEDFKELKNDISNLKTSVDAIALDKKNNDGKILSLEHRVKNTENFIDQAAPKLNLTFEH